MSVPVHLARAVALAVTLAAALLAAPAAAQNLTVSLTPGATSVTHGQDSVISLDVRNGSATATLSDIEFKLPKDYVALGGAGPPGWSITRILGNGFWSIRFRATSCVVGVAPGQTGTFRMEATAAGGSVTADEQDALKDVTVHGSCGTGSFSLGSAWRTMTFPRKVLELAGAIAPTHGATGLVSDVVWTVTNHASVTVTGVAVTPVVVPASGWTSAGCTPASLTLGAAGAASATQAVTCRYTYGAAGTYRQAGSARGTGGGGATASSVEVVAGDVNVAAVTAKFRFESLVASTGERLRAIFTVTNNGGGPLTVRPPRYAELALTSLAPPPGAADPGEKNVPAGKSEDFTYSFDVTAVVGSPYVAAGAAVTSLGATNVATTPAGTVSDTRVEIVPNAVVRQRISGPPYAFDVEVTNNSAYAVEELRLVNPQNAAFTNVTHVSATGLTYSSVTRNSPAGTDFITYTGSLAPGASAVFRVRFDALPTVSITTHYPFAFRVYPRRGGELLREIVRTIAVSTAPPDVADFTILSDASGQTLQWRNVSTSAAPHDGVVIFRAATAGALPLPADGVDYADPANAMAGLVYADRDGSTVTRYFDATTGELAYRVCAHDARFVYSPCTTAVRTSAIAPAGGWTHNLGGAALLVPGAVPGSRLAVGTNARSLAILDATTGLRVFDPIPLLGNPSRSTPAFQLVDGRRVILAADDAGGVTAVDLEAGAPLWQVALSGEVFVGGLTAINHRYAPAAFRAAYTHDVLLVPSTTGRVLGLDAATGAVVWTLDVSAAAGKPVSLRAGVTYDHASGRLYVPTTAAGVYAFDVNASTPVASDPPDPIAGWSNPSPTGQYTLACTLGPVATDLACADRSGLVLVVDRATGAEKARLATGVTLPATLWPVSGASAGYVLSSAAQTQRLVLSGTPATLALAGTAWVPGATLSPAQVFATTQTIVVGASDRKLHQLRLADTVPTGAAAPLPSSSATLLLGPSVFDSVGQRFVFGAEDGRVWAVKAF